MSKGLRPFDLIRVESGGAYIRDPLYGPRGGFDYGSGRLSVTEGKLMFTTRSLEATVPLQEGEGEVPISNYLRIKDYYLDLKWEVTPEITIRKEGRHWIHDGEEHALDRGFYVLKNATYAICIFKSGWKHLVKWNDCVESNFDLARRLAYATLAFWSRC